MAAPSLLTGLNFREPQVLLRHLEPTWLGFGHGEWTRHTRAEKFSSSFFFLQEEQEVSLLWDCKEIKPVSLWIFIGRADDEAPILQPPDVKNQLIGKDPDVGKEWRQKEKRSTGWDDWIASLTQWTWIWANSGKVKDRGAWWATVHGVAE